MSTRPCGALVVVTATGTDTGKTWWCAEIAREARARGLSVVARKPAQSFAPGDVTTDADVLADATGDRGADVCPPHRSYPVPLAPPMAAETLGREPFTIADLDEETTWPGRPDVALVEGAGATRSPLASDGDNVDLARALGPTFVLLVADPGLGTISSVRLGVDALASLPVVVALNRFSHGDDLHVRNRGWLTERDGLDVVTRPDQVAERLAAAVTPAPRPAGRSGPEPASSGTG